MGIESSSESGQGSSQETAFADQWASNAQPSAYGTNQLQSLLDAYKSETKQAFAPYTETGAQAVQKAAGLLGLEGFDPMSQQLSGLGGLIAQGYNIPMPGHVRYGADEAHPDVGYPTMGDDELRTGATGVPSDPGNANPAARLNRNIVTGDSDNMPDPLTRTDFNVDTLDGRRRAQNEMERRTYVSNSLTDNLREAELDLARLNNLTDPGERQTAFDKINENLTAAADFGGSSHAEDPYWNRFLKEFTNDIKLYQEDLRGDFKSELPEPESIQSVLESTPGYQFRLEQGRKAIDTSLAGRGMRGSGQQAKALTEYGQGLASQEYNTILGQYMQAAGLGAQTTQQEQAQQTQLGLAGASGMLAGSGTIIRGPKTMHSESQGSMQQSSSGSSKGVSL